MKEYEWEQVNKSPSGSVTERLKIEGGWLYHLCIKSHDRTFHTSMCFVPDDNIENLDQQTLPFDERLLIPIDDLELTVRSCNCLRIANIFYMGDIVCNPYLFGSYNKIDDIHPYPINLKKITNLGLKSYCEIKNQLNKLDLCKYIDCPNYLLRRHALTGIKYEFGSCGGIM